MKSYDQNNIPLAKDLHRNMTPWERKLWYAFLRSYPVRFQRQKALGAYIVDFYCAKARLALELDGGGHYTPEQKERDAARAARRWSSWACALCASAAWRSTATSMVCARPSTWRSKNLSPSQRHRR